jgi:hypothetical protein
VEAQLTRNPEIKGLNTATVNILKKEKKKFEDSMIGYQLKQLLLTIVDISKDLFPE